MKIILGKFYGQQISGQCSRGGASPWKMALQKKSLGQEILFSKSDCENPSDSKSIENGRWKKIFGEEIHWKSAWKFESGGERGSLRATRIELWAASPHPQTGPHNISQRAWMDRLNVKTPLSWLNAVNWGGVNQNVWKFQGRIYSCKATFFMPAGVRIQTKFKHTDPCFFYLNPWEDHSFFFLNPWGAPRLFTWIPLLGFENSNFSTVLSNFTAHEVQKNQITCKNKKKLMAHGQGSKVNSMKKKHWSRFFF